MVRSAFAWPALLCLASAGWLAGALALSAPQASAEPWNGAANSYVHHGVMLARQGDWQGALADFDAALTADPSLAAAHVDRGFVLLRVGDPRTALDEADTAVRLAPMDPLAHNLRGRAEERLGDIAAARQEFRQALALAPGNPAIARNLGRLNARFPSREGGDAAPDTAWRAAPPVPPFPAPQAPLPRTMAPLSDASRFPAPQLPAPPMPAPQTAAPQTAAPQTAAPEIAAPRVPPPQVATTWPAVPAPPTASESWPTQPTAPLPRPSPPALAQPSPPSPPPNAPTLPLREPPPQNLALNNPSIRNLTPRPVPDAPSVPPSAEPALLDHPQSLPPAPGVALRAGSGVVLDGVWIVTNHHVITGARSVAVRNGGGYVRHATITAVSPTDDLALLRLDRPFPATTGVPLSALITPVAGRQIIVMGYPVVDVFGSRRPNLTPGLVARTDGLRDDPATFQLTAAIRPGNSGSPVFDLQGHLLGIISDLLLQQGRIPAIADEGGAAMSIAIKASRVLALMHRGAMTVSQSVDAPMLPETLYQKELTSVVLVVAYP